MSNFTAMLFSNESVMPLVMGVLVFTAILLLMTHIIEKVLK